MSSIADIRAAADRFAAAVVVQTAELQAPAPSCVGLPPEVDQLMTAIENAGLTEDEVDGLQSALNAAAHHEVLKGQRVDALRAAVDRLALDSDEDILANCTTFGPDCGCNPAPATDKERESC